MKLYMHPASTTSRAVMLFVADEKIPLDEQQTTADSVEILVNNLFKRMSPARRGKFIKLLKAYVKGEGPDSHEDFEVGT